MGNTEIRTDVKLLKHQKNEYTLKAGKQTATVSIIQRAANRHSHFITQRLQVNCKNKREGKQLAAQQLLAKLHPTMQYWGQLLRLYGRGSCRTPKEKKQEEQKITELQSTACANKPNYAILQKLRDEMQKLQELKVRA